MVAVALVLGVSIVATPVLAQVHDVKVSLDDYRVGAEAEYTITFNISRSLHGAKFYIEFPDDTFVPTEYEDGKITVKPKNGEVYFVPKGDIRVNVREVEINTILSIKAPEEVTVVFKKDAGIENPSEYGTYTLDVWTNEEDAGSVEYDIVLPDRSTYKFVCEFEYEDPVSKIIWVDKDIDVEVTLKTKVKGNLGYDGVQKQIRLAKDPSAGAVVEVKIGDFEETLTVDEWVSWGAPFSIQAHDRRDWTGTMRFNRVGEYTIEFRLRHEGSTVGEGTVTAAVSGLSLDIELKEGWNLVSLPLIPESSAIETVLAGIMDDVISVWYYDAADPNPVPEDRWRSYDPEHSEVADLHTIEDGKAYWVRMAKGADLTVVGVATALPGEMPRAYNVVEGWNMVGFQSTGPMLAKDYFEGTALVRVYKFESGAWSIVQPTQNMEPGLGYWVAFSEPGTIYP